MFELKPLHPDSIPAALEKARHYRLLNEPLQAESICLDILEVDPRNQEALITLLLALTDQFEHRLQTRFRKARSLLPQLDDEYSRLYYDGILCERRALAHFKRGGPGSGYVAYDWFRQAMEYYEQAEKLRPPENDDPVLRWNTCARIVMRNPELKPEPEQTSHHFLE
ncbi:MAG: hypothetical protein ACE5G0_08505 [Rhodothermales bacterium]